MKQLLIATSVVLFAFQSCKQVNPLNESLPNASQLSAEKNSTVMTTSSFTTNSGKTKMKKWSKQKSTCINVEENCYPEVVIIGKPKLDDLAHAIETGSTADFFALPLNAELFLPDDVIGNMLQGELRTGHFHPYIKQVNNSRLAIFYGPGQVNEDHFSYVFEVTIDHC